MAFETMTFDVNDVNADEWNLRALNIIGHYGLKVNIASEDVNISIWYALFIF